MTDLVERLKARKRGVPVGAGGGQTYVPSSYTNEMFDEDQAAAAEITRLREEVERLEREKMAFRRARNEAETRAEAAWYRVKKLEALLSQASHELSFGPWTDERGRLVAKVQSALRSRTEGEG